MANRKDVTGEVWDLLGLTSDPGKPLRRPNGGTTYAKMSAQTLARLKGDDSQKARLKLEWRLRLMSNRQFMETCASPELKRAYRHGLVFGPRLLNERVQAIYGSGFMTRMESYRLDGTQFSWTVGREPVDKAVELYDAWLTDHQALHPEEQFEFRFIDVEEEDGKHRCGAGVVVKKSTALFVPNSGSTTVYAIMVPWLGPDKGWGDVVNVFERGM